jgi:dihydrofolate synthase/folylpolyglutamate synthase
MDTQRSTALLAHLKTLHPLLIDLSLDRIRGLLFKLGSPERRLPPVIHIAGTNGKGSTTALLRAMFEGSGKRVHVYTSPHLVHFHERISVPGQNGSSLPIAEERLVEFLERVTRANAGAPMTFFEITTAAAFLAFSEIPADAVILEVGLGGDFDATNVIDRPALSLITPIAIDHADKLGDTIARIARVKAGILKTDCEAVISLQTKEALEVIRARAREVRAPVFVFGEDYDAFVQNGRLVYQSEAEFLDLPLPALIGRHQIVNAGAAIAAAQRLRPIGMNDTGIERGLVTVRWPARMQRLDAGPLVQRLRGDAELWLDGGHNPHGAAAIAQTLADIEERAPKPLFLIVGMMGQKDAEGFLRPFRGLARRIVAVPIPGAHENPFEPAALAALAVKLGFAAETATSVPAALDQLRKAEAGAVRVLICGSLYLAGHVLALQDGSTPQSN